MNIVTKNRGIKRREKIFKKNMNSVSKKCWKKIVSKKFEIMFFNIHMNIETINGGKKARKKFYQKHTYYASYKRWKKIAWKKCENTFFINT